MRVVVNGKNIYPLENSKPVVIPVDKDKPKIVVTDGFNLTKPLELVYKQPGYFNFDVVCAINDMQLLGGGLFLSFFYLLGFFTGIIFLKLISFVPLILLLCGYYLNRKNFIRLVRARQ